MIRASDLIGCVLRTESGRRLGRVHDLRAQSVNDGWQIVGLVAGRGGMLARLVGDTGSDALAHGDVIPWRAVTALGDGWVIVRDEAGEISP